MKSRILATALSLSMLSSPAAHAVSNNTWADISVLACLPWLAAH